MRRLALVIAAVVVAFPAFAQQPGNQAAPQPGTSAATNYTPFPNGRAEWSLTLTQDQARALADFYRQLEMQKLSGGAGSAPAGLLAETRGDFCVRCGGGGQTQDFQAFGEVAAAARALLVCPSAYALTPGRCTP